MCRQRAKWGLVHTTNIGIGACSFRQIGATVKGVALTEDKEYYSVLSRILKFLRNEQSYNWLITDYECYVKDPAASKLFLKSGNENYIWLSEDKLYNILEEEEVLWIWGIISGFKPEVTFEEVLEYDLPYIQNDLDILENGCKIAHPLADIEIIPWDGVMMITVSRDDKIIDSMVDFFPLAKELIKVQETEGEKLDEGHKKRIRLKRNNKPK